MSKYNCPMCLGEGKIDSTIRDEYAHYRLWGYAGIFLSLFLGGSILSWAVSPSSPPAPRAPSQLEQCATACGARFKSWTEPVREWTEYKPRNEPNIIHNPIPGKCECSSPFEPD